MSLRPGMPPWVDAGMFPERPGLRHTKAGDWQSSRWRNLIDQTDLVTFLRNLASDPMLAEQFNPLPLTIEDFERTETEAVQLPNGQWLAFHTIYPEHYHGLLPEAAKNEEAAVLQATCKPRDPTQWWLVAEPRFLEVVKEEQFPLLASQDNLSYWVPTFDEKPKHNFYLTSVGACFSHIEAMTGSYKI